MYYYSLRLPRVILVLAQRAKNIIQIGLAPTPLVGDVRALPP